MPRIRPGLIASASAGLAGSLPTPNVRWEARRRIIAFALVGIGAYLLALVALTPASLFMKNQPWRTGVGGTIWNGEVGVAGGSRLEWHWAPLRSLTSLAYAADWKAAGPNTDLGGRALVGWRSVTLDHVSGSADGSLISALQTSLPFTCDFTQQIDMERIVVGGSNRMVQGRAVTDPGSCRAKGALASTPVPALLLTAEHIGNQSRIRITPMNQRRKLLVDAILDEDGKIDITVTPEGSTMLPFLGAPPGMRFQGLM